MSARWRVSLNDGRTLFAPGHWTEAEALAQLSELHGEQIVAIVREGADNPADIQVTGHHELS